MRAPIDTDKKATTTRHGAQTQHGHAGPLSPLAEAQLLTTHSPASWNDTAMTKGARSFHCSANRLTHSDLSGCMTLGGSCPLGNSLLVPSYPRTERCLAGMGFIDRCSKRSRNCGTLVRPHCPIHPIFFLCTGISHNPGAGLPDVPNPREKHVNRDPEPGALSATCGQPRQPTSVSCQTPSCSLGCRTWTAHAGGQTAF